jgi:hypothetical protein
LVDKNLVVHILGFKGVKELRSKGVNTIHGPSVG